MQANMLGDLLKLALTTPRKPKQSLRIVLDRVITMPDLIWLTVFIVLVNTILTVIFPTPPLETNSPLFAFYTALYANPLVLFLVQLVSFFSLAALITFVGRTFKGYATLKEVLTALVWLQFIQIIISIFQLVIIILIPQILPFFALFFTMLSIHLFVSFCMEIHGFKNPLLVVAGIVFTFFGIAFITAILLLLLGYAPEAIQNV